jgi:hypothetical protein
VHGSENVGMSNHKADEKSAHRKPEVSWATLIVPGLVGPKLRPKGVGDGQQVDTPVLLISFLFVTQDGSQSIYWLGV